MSDLTIIDAALPAHLAAAGFVVEANDDLSQGVSQSFPILSYKGKVWHVCEGKERSLVADASGDPVPSVEVVILKANPKIGKTYYPTGYEEGSDERPACYSNDSVAPAPDSLEPQAKKCAVCPHNQFGSKITENGARGKACSDFRRLAVAPEGDISRAMLLRVPAASLKELLAFADQLNKRKVPYQALVTKIGFDHTVSYPKLSFKMVRWLDEKQVPQVQAMLDSDIIETITAMNAPTQAEADGDFEAMGAPPAHVAEMKAEPIAEKPAPKATKAKATAAEVAAVVEPAATAAPKASGFGGGSSAKAAPEPVAAAAEPEAPAKGATVLVSGAMAELDAVLGQFDD